jgi:hypothetical protein
VSATGGDIALVESSSLNTTKIIDFSSCMVVGRHHQAAGQFYCFFTGVAAAASSARAPASMSASA